MRYHPAVLPAGLTLVHPSLQFLFGCWLGIALAVVPAQALDLAALPPPDPLQFLAVQRSAALFNAQSPQSRHSVRMVIYGQSITQQQWAWDLVSQVHGWHPGAFITAEVRAIPALDASFLIQTAESDIFPFHPDVIVFHAYGPYGPGLEWERLLRAFRARTTADVILLGNHPLKDLELEEPAQPAEMLPDSQAWLNYVTTSTLATELGFCFPDNRSAFKAYLKATHQPVRAILADNLHLNTLGSDVQFAVVRPFLQAPRFTPALDPFNNGRVQTHPIGDGGPDWVGGRLRFEFVGNRLDAIAAPGSGRRCQVRVDGQEPTSMPSGMGHRRSSAWRGDPYLRPALLQVGFTQKPLVEHWTVTVTDEDPRRPEYLGFEVSGSRTGPDGTGTTTNVFVSNSGRVRIAPENWSLIMRPRISQLGLKIEWVTETWAVDDYVPAYLEGDDLEPVTTLVNDLPDGPHVLELLAESPEAVPALAALRVYHPAGPMPGTEVPRNAEVPPTLRLLSLPDRALAAWPGTALNWSLFRQPTLDARWAAVPATTNRGGFSHLFLPTDGPTGFFRLE